MAAIDQTDCNNIINATLGNSTYTTVSSVKVRLGTSAPTSTSNMTQLSGTGYTAGGTACSFSSASSAATSNTTVLSWTNSSGSSWSIVGIEIWDTAGTPLRHWFGSWTGQPITVANGNTFAVAAAAIAISLS